MTDITNRAFLRLCVAKICQDVGFNSIQSTPLEVLTDLLQDYMTELAKTAYNYALHCGNTEPNLNHLALAFQDMGVSITELKEYVRYVDSSIICECPKYPVSKESHLNLLKPGSREVVTRPFHIHEHLPPMHPHLEDLELSIKQESNADSSSESTTSPVSNSKSKSFKRPGDLMNEELPSKRGRFVSEEEGRPLRELSSIMMTTSGFLSPAREGKLPEARTPLNKAEFPLHPETNSNSAPINEPKTKKKGKLSPDLRKLDKDVKLPCEKEIETVIRDDDISKQKRPNSGKEPLKKSLKLPSVKCNTSSSAGVGSNTIKPHKQGIKVKNSSNNISPLINPLFVAKPVKLKSPKIEKMNVAPAQKDTLPIQVISDQACSEYKIASEPDKQKLNIIKKISKLKEEISEDLEEKPSSEPVCLSRVDVTIESVIKREMVIAETLEQETDFKDEVVDIETVHSPSPYETLLNNNNDKNPVNPVSVPLKPEKKKKKDKKISKIDNVEPDFILSKSQKTVPDPPTINKTFEENIYNNPPSKNILPSIQITPDPFSLPVPSAVAREAIPKKDSQVVSPMNPLIFETPHVQNQCLTPNRCDPTIVTPTFVESNDNGPDTTTIKKKMHKKEKKDKLKKKKKEKIKNKEKSEKRRLKLEKKVKDKEKLKIKKDKKERRREKEVQDSKIDSTNSVPKITLKLGPVSPTNSTDNNSRKIVIIPVVKKEADVSKPERAPSPELARFSPLVQNPKQKASKSSNAEEIKSTSDIKGINESLESASLPPSVRLDSEGNKVWICPACGRQDDGSPMIGCDECDAWYHWVCVGIQVPPEVTNWYCNTCLNKKKLTESVEKKKKNKKKTISKKLMDN